ncbi:MAG: hypothetical protein RLZZ136_1216 [Pseudomonadota bacterium]
MGTYPEEFRKHWSALLGCGIGMALGNSLPALIANLFTPKLISEFGWTKAQFSLGSSVAIFLIFIFPLAGRFADRVGPKYAATLGFVGVPAGFLAYSFQSGAIYQYFVIMFFLAAFGLLSSAMVFGRVIVDRFYKARGMALSIGMSVSPLIGAALLPLIDHIIEADGWRTAYRVLAGLSAAGGCLAILLIGKHSPSATQSGQRNLPHGSRTEIFKLLKKRSFILLISGIALLALPTVMMASQLKLVLEESGANSPLATALVSLSAISIVIGRLVCGYALDRAPIHLVSFFALLLPAVGYLAIASPFNQPWVLFGAILLVGLAMGAEGDIGAMIISRKFDNKHYSLVYSCLSAAIGFAASVGAIILSVTISITESYNAFLVTAGACAIIGAFCFYLLGKTDDHADEKS